MYTDSISSSLSHVCLSFLSLTTCLSQPRVGTALRECSLRPAHRRCSVLLCLQNVPPTKTRSLCQQSRACEPARPLVGKFVHYYFSREGRGEATSSGSLVRPEERKKGRRQGGGWENRVGVVGTLYLPFPSSHSLSRSLPSLRPRPSCVSCVVEAAVRG